MQKNIPLFIGLVAAAIALFFSTVFVVDQRKHAVVFGLGEIKEVISEPGLRFKLPPPLQNVIYLDKRTLTLDSPDTDRFITEEKKNLIVDWFLKWEINEPRQFYKNFGGDERRAGDRLYQIVKAALNESIARRKVTQVLATERSILMEEVQVKITKETKDLGLRVIDVRLKRVDFVAEITDSVYRRMEAERKQEANRLRSKGVEESEGIRASAERERDVIIATAYKEAQKIKGEGDALASARYAEAFGRDPQFAKFYRSLEAYRQSFKNRSDIVVVDAQSEFFRAMRGTDVAAPAAKK
jgi:modulator of FtsH protease HflC